MAIRFTTKASKVKEPLHTVHIDNESINDKSGYLGLILNVNKNGKAIRIATRDGVQRVHVLLSEVDNLVEALEELLERGVATSTKDITYDKGVNNKFINKTTRKVA